MNNAVSVVGDWIIDSNFEKGSTLNKASLDLFVSAHITKIQL